MGTQPLSVVPPAEEVTATGEVAASGPAPVPASAPAPSGVVATRASRTWVKVLPAVVLLAVLLLFVFQNLHSTRVSFATTSGTFPLALALLAAAALGGLSVLALGSVRILQLRKVIHRAERRKT